MARTGASSRARLRGILAMLALLLTVAALGCRAVLGALDDCQTDGDCAAQQARWNTPLVCRAQLCVAAAPDAATEAGPSALDPRCTTVGSDAGAAPIRIGAILQMTLPMDAGADPRGVFRLDAVRLAFDQLNPPTRGGINGRPLQVIVCDNQGDSTQAAALATSLINQGVPAILGATSGDILQEATVTVPNHVLLISSSATAAEITTLAANDPQTGVRMVWRTAPPDTFQGKVMANVLAHGLDGGFADAQVDGGNARNLGVFELNNAYGQGLYSAIQADYPGPSDNAHTYTQNGDVTAALQGVAAHQPAPQVLVTIAFPADAVNIINGANGMANLSSLPWFFSDTAKSPDLFKGLNRPSQIEGALGTAPAAAAAPAPAIQWFDQQFQDTYALDPLSASFIANTFDAAMLLAIAADWASTAPNKLDGPTKAQALTQLSTQGAPVINLDPVEFDMAVKDLATGPINVEGASGHLDFDRTSGEAPASVEVWQVVDGGFTTVAVQSP